MKHTRHAPAVTSLPQAPNDEATHRVRRYALTMGIRMVCFILMVAVQPYGWHTWAFAIGAAVLPYIAVVFANAGSDSTESTVESPLQQIETTRPAPPADADDVIVLHESRVDEQGPVDERGREDEQDRGGEQDRGDDR